jgi:hypothetical protein
MTGTTRAWVAGCVLGLVATVSPRTDLLAGAEPQLPPRDVTAQRQGGAVIRGVVVDGVSGAPIRRAAVSLVVEQPDRESSRVLATTADAGGQFEFTGVPAARVQITASRPGYFDYDNVWNGEPEEPVWQTVAAGQRIQGVRIALYRGGAITGRIVDEFGEPAAGIEIDVLRREPRDAGGAVRTTSMSLTPTTDDTGAFRVWGLAPGDYIVGARPNRFVAETPGDAETRREGYSATYYPGTPVLANARAVRVTAGRDTGGVAFGLVTVPLATVRGVVLLPPDIPGRAVSVGVSLVAPQRLDGYVTRSVRPRDDGSFELTRLAPGSYQMTARQFQQGGVEYYGTTDIEVNGGDLDGVTVAMRRGAIVRGRVLTESGEPVGVPVMVSLVPGADRAPMPRPVRTYSDGSFRLEGAFGSLRVQAVQALLVPGAESPGINVRALQDVTAASRALTTWWVKSITLNGRDVTDQPIDFDQGDATLAITMTNRTAIVRGTVAFTPAAGRRRPAVVVFADDDTRWQRPTRVVGTGEVDDSGRFEVRGLPPGDRYLAVAVEGVSRAVLARPEMLAAVRASALAVRVDEGGSHELALRAIPRPTP